MSAVATDLAERAEQHRPALLGYCYRFLGSPAEAEDAVQETMLRAWRKAETFRGDAALRTWLYRVAVNVCTDMTRAPQRRALPADLADAGRLGSGPPVLGAPLGPEHWVWPIADERLPAADPADVVAHRESVRLAFLAALQHLPARQRAVLILRDVLAFSAQETAQVLEVSVDAVTSALARARATVRDRAGEPPAAPPDAVERAIADRYVAAFEAYDVDALVRMLADDASFTMPPYTFWLRGTEQIERWWRGPGEVCRGARVLRARLNDRPAVAAYHAVGDPTAATRWEPFAVHVLEISDHGIESITHYLGPTVFADLGLPGTLLRDDRPVPRA